MFKNLLLFYAGVLGTLYASELSDLEVTLVNQTSKPVLIQKVIEDYSNLSSEDIGEGMEIDAGKSLSLKIFVLSSRYFTHIHQNTRCDGVMFKVLDDSKENFSILWEKNFVSAENLEKLFSYKVDQKHNESKKFEFVLLNK